MKRKTGLIILGAGLLLAAVLFALRQTSWFANEQLKTMSELAEGINAAFWAALVVAGMGLILFFRALLIGSQDPPASPLETEEVWVCPDCGEENTMDSQFCSACGKPFDRSPIPEENGDWTCPWCGTVHNGNASVCTACGYDRFAE